MFSGFHSKQGMKDGGAKIGDDVVRQEIVQNQWVKKNTKPRKQFDTWNEKAIFKEGRQ
jgi:hypothetical protein